MVLKAGNVPINYWVTYGCCLDATVTDPDNPNYIDFTVTDGTITKAYSTLLTVGTFKGEQGFTVGATNSSISIQYVCVNATGKINNIYITATPLLATGATHTSA
jgi:hypothetical protein